MESTTETSDRNQRIALQKTNFARSCELDVERRKALAVKQRQARSSLDLAVGGDDIESLTGALHHAREVGVAERDLDEAVGKLEHLHSHEAAKALQHAGSTGSIKLLCQALRRGREQGLDAASIQAASDRLADLQQVSKFYEDETGRYAAEMVPIYDSCSAALIDQYLRKANFVKNAELAPAALSGNTVS